MAQLNHWRENGDRLIVCLETNENIYNKGIGRNLSDRDGLSMSKVVGDLQVKIFGLPTSGDQLQFMGYGENQMLQWWDHA